ncbi:MAG: hypothetical protein EOS22_03605 [Mesorhizobium sp.]|nr:MAG: hypothetical protein EOS22_03605 [Mesorhizobium sp.]
MAIMLIALPDIWGKGTTSSSDGQYFRTGRGRGGHAAVNAKYGIDPGVRFYTHVSDQYGPYHSVVISATGSEAPHVLDGLMRHGTSLKLTEHYTDTGGASDHVFGLSHLLGFRFVPRLRDLPERRLASIGPANRYPGLKDIMGRPIRADAIAECWEQVVRTTASIHRALWRPPSSSRNSPLIGARTGWIWLSRRSAASCARCSRSTGSTSA